MSLDILMSQDPTRYSDIYTSLSRSRVIFLCEDITKDVAASLCGLLIYYDNISHEPITILIHTNGGDSAALASIYDVMSLVSSPISTICIGKAYSAGAFILSAGTKGHRHILPNADIMIHGLQCAFPMAPLSDQTDSSIYFNYLENLNKRIMKILAKHTGQPLNKIEQDSKRDFYLDANAAVKYGIVDSILG